MREAWKVFALVGGCNLVATLHGVGYGALAERIPGALPPRASAGAWALSAFVASYAVGAVILHLLLRRTARVVAALRRGEAPAAADLEHSRRRALNLPVHVARMSTLIWLTVGASFFAWQHLVATDVETIQTLHVVLATVLTGAVAGTFVFYTVEWHARRTLVPILFPDGKLSGVAGVQPVTVAFKIVVLVTVSVLLPVAVLTVVGFAGILTPALIGYLGGSFFVAGVLQAAAIARSITRPVADLARAVDRVKHNDLEAAAPVVSVDDVGALAEGFNEMVGGLKRAEFVKDTFGRYVSRQVLDEILGGKVALGGELRRATVLFSDIRGFTALAERMPPADVVAFLNRYLDIMVDVLVEHGGTIDKFIGDAIMASFGVPIARDDDALRAVRASLVMIERLAAWNVERVRAGEPPIEIGIGVHTGDVVAGNIGSAKKMEYTVIGDTVNTSSRIEQLNKKLGSRLLVSTETWELVKDAVVGRAHPPLEVPGKRLPIVVHEVSGLRDPGI